MKTTLAILVAALPFSVSALPLYVQYEGIVVPTNAPLRAGYNIGDRISGTLAIDSVLAPRTNVQPHNGFAYYAWPGPQERISSPAGLLATTPARFRDPGCRQRPRCG